MTTFMFPMAGRSQRFFDAGYTQPKFMLPFRDSTIFHHVLLGFDAFFETSRFVFALRPDEEDRAFVETGCQALGIKDFMIFMLQGETRGQADTVAQALESTCSSPLMPLSIFNIDTLRKNFREPVSPSIRMADGYLEVFRGNGENWSFVEPTYAGSNKVLKTAEKLRISDLCCTGFYHFARSADFLSAYQNPPPARSAAERRERYVAPLYNTLIKDGRNIRYRLVAPEHIAFAGTPSEYEALLLAQH